MSRRSTHRWARPAGAATLAAGLLAAGVLVAGVLTGCGTPAGLRRDGVNRPPTASPAPTSYPTPTPPRPVLPPPAPTAPARPSFAESFASPCNGSPGVDEVIRVVRRESGALPERGSVAVAAAPVCAGTWQYTVLQVPEREPLGVVTQGRPGALSLVTAGTDVCSIPVRTAAPAGIRAAAGCF